MRRTTLDGASVAFNAPSTQDGLNLNALVPLAAGQRRTYPASPSAASANRRFVALGGLGTRFDGVGFTEQY